MGRLLEGLAGDGRLDRTVVVVLGDHGESLGEHREATHGFFVYDATVQIPLLMAGPAIAPRKVGDQVTCSDATAATSVRAAVMPANERLVISTSPS